MLIGWWQRATSESGCERPMAKGIKFGTWYPASGNPGIYFSLVQPMSIAPEVLQSNKTLVNDLDSVLALSLCFVIGCF